MWRSLFALFLSLVTVFVVWKSAIRSQSTALRIVAIGYCGDLVDCLCNVILSAVMALQMTESTARRIVDELFVLRLACETPAIVLVTGGLVAILLSKRHAYPRQA